jgi:CelD/BcsL family acetyltransferase involved in cellulose biosynthesis
MRRERTSIAEPVARALGVDEADVAWAETHDFDPVAYATVRASGASRAEAVEVLVLAAAGNVDWRGYARCRSAGADHQNSTWRLATNP